MAKQTTKAFRYQCAKKAVENYAEGITYTDTARQLGVSVKSLWSWVRQLKNEELTNGGDRQQDFVPKDLIEAVVDDFNKDLVEVLVYLDSMENGIRIVVDRPNINDIKLFQEEVERRVLKQFIKKLEWCFVVKGFKFS